MTDYSRYIIRCKVSGGVTGTRFGALKGADGSIQTFTKTEAEDEAQRLNANANHPNAKARFEYWPEPEYSDSGFGQ